MKKIFMFVAVSLLLLTSCNDKNTHIDEKTMTPINEISQSLDSDLNKAKSAGYQNLKFNDDVFISFPKNLSEVSVLSVVQNDAIDQKTCLDIFESSAKTLLGLDSLDEKYCFFNTADSSIALGENSLGNFVYPLISAYRDKLISGEIPLDFYMYQTDTDGVHADDKYLLIGDKLNIVKLNKGNDERKLDKERGLAGWMPFDNYQITTHYVDCANETTSYALDNGDMTIAQATAFCEDYFNNKLPFDSYMTSEFTVHQIDLMEANGGYAYRLLLSKEYAGIGFDSMNTEGVGTDSSDKKKYVFDSTEALMTNTNDIEFIYSTEMSPKFEKTSESSANIISLGSAVKIVSENLSEHVQFEVSRIEFLYCPYYNDDSHTTQTARPMWKITAYNPNDQKYYYAYADALSGAFHYYSMGGSQ